MKKRSVFLSKVFAVALAASLALGAPSASAALVDSTTTYEGAGLSVVTKDSNFWGGWSDFYRVSGDFDVTLELTNKGDGFQLWNNYLIVFSTPVDYAEGDPNGISGYSEYCVIRSDNWAWGGGDNTTSEGNPITYTDMNLDDFSAIMSDAKVSLNIVRTGQDVTIKNVMTGADSKTISREVKFILTPESVNFFITGEHADVNIVSYTVNSGAVNTPDASTPETPDTTTGPAIDVNPDENQAPAPDDTTPVTPIPDDTTPTDPAPETPDDQDKNETEAPAPSLSKKKLTVKVGQSKKLSVKNAEGTVKWTSNKKKVATVKNGKVTGKKKGTATITATVDGKKLTCKVTVTKK